ncbi:MAG: diguanylate cyclase [Christensenella sp.]|nr:diguanylate cyclase [Christensenella sp.]
MTSVYMPAGYNGWYIQIAVPDRYIMGLFYATATGIMWTFAAVLAGFVILIFVFMRIVHREQMSLRLQAARFQIIQKTAQCNLYEYDVINDVLRYEFVKTDGNVLHGEQTHYLKEKKYEQQIREDFWMAYEHFVRRLIRTPGASMIECPVKIGNEGYLWYRLYFQSVTGSKGNTITLIGSSININDLIMQRDLARAAAALDPLTGVLTGKAFAAQALETYEKNRKEKESVLAVINIDRFQGLIGRPEADKKLTMVGDLLPVAFGDESIIGRYEGAGFLVFFPEAEGISIEEKFRRLKKLLAKEQTTMPVKTTCNMGALIIPAGCSMNFNAILDRAYYLAYRIKEDGKENFVIERL